MALGLKHGLNCLGNGFGIKAWACSVQRLCINSPLGKVRPVMCPSLEVPRDGMCCVCLPGSGLGFEGTKCRSCSCSCRKAQSLLSWFSRLTILPQSSQGSAVGQALTRCHQSCWMSPLHHSSTSGVKLGPELFSHPLTFLTHTWDIQDS